MRDKLIEIISDIEVCVRFWEVTEGEILPPEKVASIVADKLIAKGVTILPEGAITLTKAEIDALNKHNEKAKCEFAREIFTAINNISALVKESHGFVLYIEDEKFGELEDKYTKGKK